MGLHEPAVQLDVTIKPHLGKKAPPPPARRSLQITNKCVISSTYVDKPPSYSSLNRIAFSGDLLTRTERARAFHKIPSVVASSSCDHWGTLDRKLDRSATCSLITNCFPSDD